MNVIYLVREATNTVFIVNALLMLFEAWIFLYVNSLSRSEERKQKNKRIFCILASVQWILISGLRHDIVGDDTWNYMALFDRHIQYSWEEIFGMFRDYYSGVDKNITIEPGYILFEKMLSLISTDHIFYKFAVATIFMSAFGRFVYKNSSDPFISFLIYSSFMYYMFSLTGYRQVISVSIGILAAYEYVKQKKFFKFLLCVLIGSLLHRSTIIFIVYYFIANKKITKPYIATVCSIAVAFLVFRGPMFRIVNLVLGYEYTSYSEAGSPTTFAALLFIILTVSIILYKKVFKIDKSGHVQHYYNGLFIAAVGLFAAFVNPTALRVVYDFLFFMLLLVPKLLDTFVGQKDRLIAYSVVVGLMLFYILTNTTYYVFHWA